MAFGNIRCFLGFSVRHTNGFSEHLERRSAELDRHLRDGNLTLHVAISTLHDAVDAGLGGESERARECLARGLRELVDCNEHLTGLGDGLVRTRIELFERAGLDPADPLVAREPSFRALDYDEIYAELLAQGAALPQRVLWDELAARLRDGGARAALRLLDRQVREVQSDLRSFLGQVEILRSRPAPAMAEALHGLSVASAAPVLGFVRLLTLSTYLALTCERATQLHERRQSDEPLAAAV